MSRLDNQPALPDLSKLGKQPHAPQCPHPSMIPMAFRWAYLPNGESVLACIEAHCFGCGVHANFDPPRSKAKEVKSDESNSPDNRAA